MKKIAPYISLFVFIATAFCFVNTANAGEAPDAWVKGLWIQATGLPEDAALEDYSSEDEKPWLIYSWGEGSDGPAVSLGVGRFADLADDVGGKFLNLDKSVLREFIGSQAFWESPDAEKLTFTEAPEEFLERFTYPCQVVRYTESDMGLSFMVLFIETDPFLFMAQITWETANENFTKNDAEKVLANLVLVEQ
ncbi:MAG: hypothetical protein GX256_08550 [Fretibacterium sp.]|nr:hypothetical protein [Fretibacterium sp.]